MNVQPAGLVVVPRATKLSARLAPEGIVTWYDGGSIMRVSPAMWYAASHTLLTRSPGRTADSSQPLTAVVPWFTIVNCPWKPPTHCFVTEYVTVTLGFAGVAERVGDELALAECAGLAEAGTEAIGVCPVGVPACGVTRGSAVG